MFFIKLTQYIAECLASREVQDLFVFVSVNAIIDIIHFFCLAFHTQIFYRCSSSSDILLMFE